MTKTNHKAAKPPVAKLRSGLINASIWQRESEKGTFYSVSFERRYTDKEGTWHSTTSFNHDDLFTLADLAERANVEILNLMCRVE